jgi:hypothetical protein
VAFRIAVAIAYAIVLGAWEWGDQHGNLSAGYSGVGLIAGAVVVGAVCRWWAIPIVLAGWLAPLVYLQATGFVSQSDDGNPPLGFVQIVRFVFAVGIPLWIGLAIRLIWEGRRRRPDREATGDL